MRRNRTPDHHVIRKLLVHRVAFCLAAAAGSIAYCHAGFSLVTSGLAGTLFGPTSRFFSENVDLNYSEVLGRASYKW